jgi:hypothetical protein
LVGKALPSKASGPTERRMGEQFDFTREQINAVLEFAARSLDSPVPASAASPVNAHYLDHVTPKGLARSLSGHTVMKAKDRNTRRNESGWPALP